LFLAAPLHANDTRSLTVIVTVVDPDGGPVEGCEVNVKSGLNPANQSSSAQTNVQGMAAIALQVNSEENRVFLAFTPGGDDQVTRDVSAARRERFWELLSQYALPGLTQYPIAQGQSELKITINLNPGITVFGHALDHACQPIENVKVHARSHPLWGRGQDDGAFEIAGIKKSADAIVFVMTKGMTLPIHLDATQTSGNVNLGDVQFPPEDGNAVARITIDRAGWRPNFFEATMHGVSLISEDGQRIYSFLANQQGQALTTYMTGSRLLPLPPDTYYLVPGGTFTANRPVHLAALDLVRSGQAANVQGWPKLVAVSGQNDEITINAAAVDQAIMQAAGKEK